MKKWNPFTNERYLPLHTNFTETTPLIIDTQANPQDILEAALQRIRASSDLLQTLHCQCFKHGDLEDIPHITHALYLLTQDGCDLLKVAQQRMMGWKAQSEITVQTGIILAVYRYFSWNNGSTNKVPINFDAVRQLQGKAMPSHL